MLIKREHAMKMLKRLDLTEVEKQLSRVKKLRDSGDPQHSKELNRLHLMIAKKTLEYYGSDGYEAFYKKYSANFTTNDGYTIHIQSHSIKIEFSSANGLVTGKGSIWDYISNDLKVSSKPGKMDSKTYNIIRRRMEDIQESERVVYPFHSLHRLAHGYFDTDICMYDAHNLISMAP